MLTPFQVGNLSVKPETDPWRGSLRPERWGPLGGQGLSSVQTPISIPGIPSFQSCGVCNEGVTEGAEEPGHHIAGLHLFAGRNAGCNLSQQFQCGAFFEDLGIPTVADKLTQVPVEYPPSRGELTPGKFIIAYSYNNTRPDLYSGGVPSGRLLHRDPIAFKDSSNQKTLSFSTTFTISTFGAPGSIEGVAFIIVPDFYTVGTGGGYLGLLHANASSCSTATSTSHTLGVEVDFQKTEQFGDPDYIHIGIDLGNMTSLAVAPALIAPLTSGYAFQVWIEYHNPTGMLETRISDVSQRPAQRPAQPSTARRMNLELSDLLLEYMYVGFSAAVNSCDPDSNVSCRTFVKLSEWSFRTFHWDSNATVAEVQYPSLYPTLASRNKRAIACALVVLALAVLVAAGLYMYFRWEDRRLSWRFNVDANIEAGPHNFCYHELSLATKGFSSKQALGRGGFGSVYKGFLPGNQVEVAVKRVTHDSKQGEKEFLAEVHIIGKIRHRNLVTLQGWCHERGELLLVYDYLSGGSLDRLLFKEQASENALPADALPADVVGFSWENRVKAVRGIAAAVAYLHDDCDQRIMHRDIKSSNVMLDGKFNAKLGDFGLARSYQHSLLAPESTAVAGTLGYLAPELFRSGKATLKSDVYSFGVFMLEVACGRRPIEPRAPEEQFFLVDWVWDLFATSSVLEAADAKLLGQFDPEEISTVMSLALLCCHPEPEARPAMRQVVMILGGDIMMPEVPKSKPTLISAEQRLMLDELRSDSSYLQTVDNSNLRQDLSSSNSVNYSKVKPLEISVCT